MNWYYSVALDPRVTFEELLFFILHHAPVVPTHWKAHRKDESLLGDIFLEVLAVQIYWSRLWAWNSL